MQKRQSAVVLFAVSSCAFALTRTSSASVEEVGAGQAVSDANEPEPERKNTPANSIFFEGLGGAIFYSFNYERMVLRQLGVRMGVGLLPVEYSAARSSTTKGGRFSQLFAVVPVGISYVGIRAGSSALELGAGVTLLFGGGATDPNGNTTSPSLSPVGAALAGYRYQPVGRAGFMFRAGAEALVASRTFLVQAPSLGDFGVLPWPYLSVGASF